MLTFDRTLPSTVFLTLKLAELAGPTLNRNELEYWKNALQINERRVVQDTQIEFAFRIERRYNFLLFPSFLLANHSVHLLVSRIAFARTRQPASSVLNSRADVDCLPGKTISDQEESR